MSNNKFITNIGGSIQGQCVGDNQQVSMQFNNDDIEPCYTLYVPEKLNKLTKEQKAAMEREFQAIFDKYEKLVN
jgi:hypothetical protein